MCRHLSKWEPVPYTFSPRDVMDERDERDLDWDWDSSKINAESSGWDRED
jgi:hypothetical protein